MIPQVILRNSKNNVFCDFVLSLTMIPTLIEK